MKTAKEMRPLEGRRCEITIMDFRKAPGEVFAQVAMGMTFIVTRQGAPIATIGPPSFTDIAAIIEGHGHEITWEILGGDEGWYAWASHSGDYDAHNFKCSDRGDTVYDAVSIVSRRLSDFGPVWAQLKPTER